MELRTELIRAGLSSKESAVYLALLELGTQTANKVAIKAKVNRATTYVVLDSLQKKGVVSQFEKDNTTHFVAENPESILRFLNEETQYCQAKEKCVKNIMPNLLGIFNLIKDKPSVRYFEGESGLRTLREELWHDTTNMVRSFVNWDLVNALTNTQMEYLQKEREKTVKNGANFKTLISAQNKKKIELTEEQKAYLANTAYAFVDIIENHNCEFVINNDKVALFVPKETWVACLITDVSIAQCLSTCFDLAWSAAKK